MTTSRGTNILTGGLAIIFCACDHPGPNYDSTEPHVGQIVWERSLDGDHGEPTTLRLPKNMGTLEFPGDSFPAGRHVVVRVVDLDLPPDPRDPIGPRALQIAPSSLTLPVDVRWRKELGLNQHNEVAVWFSTGLDGPRRVSLELHNS